jgi:hypothetical protein
MKQQIQNTIKLYADKHNRESDCNERDAICRELEKYLKGVSSGDELKNYQAVYQALTHQNQPLHPSSDRVPYELEVWE